MADEDDLDERAARLLAQSEGIHEKAVRKRQALEWAERRAAAVEGTAASADGLIRATVDETGVLTNLELAPRVHGTRPGELARAITAVVRRAAAHARDQVRATYDGLRNEGVIAELPPNLLAAPEVDGGPVTLASVPPPAASAEERGPGILRPSTDESPASLPDPAPSGAEEERPRIMRPATESTGTAPEEPAEPETPAPRREEEGPPSTWLRRPNW
ncbi:YbaB/EbfC family nucleoid-associated protein [Amycolatopsis anabasis]|uniref:YbaB/EbfC family nucleoid-associated protein n=1 Tax=Amycolatopsis anabasis TaxID=1840409 RepID=UPI00131C2FB0|nr:YbaB/EbfC family nucleoid-associated protein [Amycolatopsis anabasis]